MKFSSAGLIVGLSLAVGLSGCVSSTKHKKTVADLNAEIAKSKEQNQALSNEKVQLEEKLIATAKDRGQLKLTLDEMKKAMAEMRERQAEQRKRLQEFEDLTQRFKKLTDAGALSVKIIDGKMVVSMGSDVLFPSGSAKLSPAGLEAIKEVTAQLQSIKGKAYQIEGHTDNLPIATAVFPSNWELASARALNVTKAMIDAGMPAQRVSAASFGDTHPIQANDTQEGRAANRRIAIVVVPDLSTMPGYDELNRLSQKNAEEEKAAAAKVAAAAKAEEVKKAEQAKVAAPAAPVAKPEAAKSEAAKPEAKKEEVKPKTEANKTKPAPAEVVKAEAKAQPEKKTEAKN